jgi:hypothetical protein
MNVTLRRSRILFLPLALTCLLPIGCGSSDSASTPATTTSISGTVSAAPVHGCELTVLDGSGSLAAGPATSSQGAFTVMIPNARLNEALVFQCTGGSYTDEASGETTTAGTLSAQLDIETLAQGISVNLTPGSTVIRGLIEAGLDKNGAETAFAGAFGYSPNPLITPNLAGNGSDEENLAGLRAGAFSWLTINLGLLPADQFTLLTALAEDLAADASLNGAGAVAMSLPEDTRNRFGASLIEQSAAMGLGADQLGALPFAKVAETASYRIEYQPGMMGAMQGKTGFKLLITDLTTGAPVIGAAPELKATMAMATKSHGTPIDGVTEVGGGQYQGTVYYLMASTMNGMSAGYWSLDVTLNGETATFHPEVGMAMGDTARATLKDAGDKLADGSIRNYFLFKDNLTGSAGNHALSLFLATQQTMMMNPALVLNMNLPDETGTWMVTSILVEASIDNGATWATMSDNGAGHWSVAGLNLSQGVQTTVLVRLTVNGVEKTANGAAGGAQATFTVTPN